jgi:hypothetical protein
MRLEEIRQVVSSLCQILPGDEKPNGYVPSQVKIFALGQVRNFFRFENRFNKRDLTRVRDTEDFNKVDKCGLFLRSSSLTSPTSQSLHHSKPARYSDLQFGQYMKSLVDGSANEIGSRTLFDSELPFYISRFESLILLASFV